MHQLTAQTVEKFTDQQKRAVCSPEGEFVVKAGAGTGKTRVLVHKYLSIYQNEVQKEILREQACDSILTVTFTRRAAKEMIERLSSIISPQVMRYTHISTIDSFCSKFIKENGFYAGIDPDFQMLDEVESKLLFRRTGVKVLENDIDWPLKIDISRETFLNDSFTLINSLKQHLITPEEFNKDMKEDPAIHKAIYLLYKKYEEFLLKENRMDFGKLLFTAYKILEEYDTIRESIQHKFKYVLVDEYQDTNLAQVKFLRLIAHPHNNYFVVGDEHQSIYGFRGAQPQHIVDFYSDLPAERKVVLNQNFRSPQPLPELVNTVFSEKLKDYYPIKSEVKGKAHIHLFLGKDKKQESDFVAGKVKTFLDAGYHPHDIIILFRGVKNCTEYEDSLRNLNIPTITVGGMGFYQQPEIKDILSMVLAVDNPHSERELLRLLRTPCFGIEDSQLAGIVSAKKEGQTLYQALYEVDSPQIKRVTDFIEYFRSRKNTVSLVELINEMLASSGLIYWAVSKNGGKNSREMSNLNKFIRQARNFEIKNIFSTVYDFAEYLRQLEDAQIVEPEARPRAKGVVHLMSIHQAKGLEFPVVFISNISRANFPAQKRMDRYHYLKGEGLIIRDKEKDSRYSRLLKDYLYSCHNQEERRLLYVAMTRTKEHLILTGTRNYQGKISRFMEYFLDPADNEYKIKPQLKKYIKLIRDIKYPDKKEIPKTVDPVKLEEEFINRAQNLGIPRFFIKRDIPNEFSVTELEAYAQCPRLYNFRYRLGIPEPPPEKPVSPQLFGTAVHRMLDEYYRLDNMKTAEDMKNKIASLILGSGISSAEYNTVYRSLVEEVIKNIRDSSILKPRDQIVFTEKSFGLKLGDALIKGTIDRVDNSGEGVELVDYKTSMGQDSSHYTLQVGIYKMALEKIFGYTVKKINIAFIRANTLKTVTPTVYLELKLKSIITGIRNRIFPPLCRHYHSENCSFKSLCCKKSI